MPSRLSRGLPNMDVRLQGHAWEGRGARVRASHIWLGTHLTCRAPALDFRAWATLTMSTRATHRSPRPPTRRPPGPSLSSRLPIMSSTLRTTKKNERKLITAGRERSRLYCRGCRASVWSPLLLSKLADTVANLKFNPIHHHSLPSMQTCLQKLQSCQPARARRRQTRHLAVQTRAAASRHHHVAPTGPPLLPLDDDASYR